MQKTEFSLAGKKVFLAGHRGMVGQALMRRLATENCELLTCGRETVDLRRQQPVEDWMADSRPDLVFMAAAHVGGILANNSSPADFLYDNLMIEANIIEASRRVGVKKLVFLGSSCIYPKHAPQPIPETALLTGPLEPTNEFYAVAKIAGIKLVQSYRRQHGCDFISAQPTNLYGPNDNFDLSSSHVLPALIRKTHEALIEGAENIVIWGSGTPKREFLHADDLADALVFLAKHYSGEEIINVGSGEEISIADLARLVSRIAGFRGRLEFDHSKPDGTPRKLLATERLRSLGWSRHIPLELGVRRTFQWYLANIEAS
jgi:GDP-L-fucose synthase